MKFNRKLVMEEAMRLYDVMISDDFEMTYHDLPNYSYDEPKEIAIQVAYSMYFLDRMAPRHLTERLRTGVVGVIKVYHDDGTFVWQRTSGNVIGTVVSVPNDKGTVTMGLSYLNEGDEDFPCIGEAKALARALEGRDNGLEFVDKKYVKSSINKQVKAFKMRSLRYWGLIKEERALE